MRCAPAADDMQGPALKIASMLDQNAVMDVETVVGR
jgi:hypothetical protein